jgi:hypothetical protein
MSDPVPYWRADRDYFLPSDARRAEHLRRIDINRRLDARIVASAGDHSYAIHVTRQEIG